MHETLTPVMVDAIPVPDSVTDCGLPVALSATESEAVRVPDAVGVKVTMMLQVLPAAREVPHTFVWEKSPALVPMMEMPVMLSAALPLFVRVTVCPMLVVPVFWSLKERELGDSEACGAGAGVTVTAAEADFVASAWLVAVTVTVAGFGTAAGAV